MSPRALLVAASLALMGVLPLGCARSPYQAKIPLGAPLAKGALTVRVSSAELPMDFLGTKADYADWMEALLTTQLEQRHFQVEERATSHLELDLMWLSTEQAAGASRCRLRATLTDTKQPEPPAPELTKRERKRQRNAGARPKPRMEVIVEANAKRRSKSDTTRLGRVAAEECVKLVVEYLEHPR